MLIKRLFKPVTIPVSTPPLNGVIPDEDGLSEKGNVARIWIQEEKANEKSLNEFEHPNRRNKTNNNFPV